MAVNKIFDMRKAIIFDFDGVIVDSFSNAFITYKEICRQLQKPFPFTNIDSFQDWYDSFWPENFRRLGITDAEEVQRGENIFRETLPQLEAPLFAGMDIVLQELARQYPLALVSANYKEEIEQKLAHYQLRSLFSAVIPSNGTVKPNPAQFYKAMQELNISPEETASVGDMAKDVLTGINAGLLENIAVSYGWAPLPKLKRELRELKIEPTAILHSPSELLDYFRS